MHGSSKSDFQKTAQYGEMEMLRKLEALCFSEIHFQMLSIQRGAGMTKFNDDDDYV